MKAAFGAWATPEVRARLPAGIEYAEIKPISRAFAPMVRELAFDISELAIATFILARAYDKPLVLLPVCVAARYQESALLCRSDDTTIAGPADLVGKRIGVRAYSQTTGVWLRGILADDFGISADTVRWVTFEDAHVAKYRDPAWCERAPAGSDMMAMLRSNELDAVIVGNDVPDDPAYRTVFPDPAAAGERFHARHGFMPVNHLIAVRREIADAEPDLVAVLYNAIPGAKGAPRGTAALAPAITLVERYAREQALLPRRLTLDDIWEGLPSALRG